jgi:hypothetical protein
MGFGRRGTQRMRIKVERFWTSLFSSGKQRKKVWLKI